MQSQAGVLGGRMGELPAIYLGMPMGAKSQPKGIWNGVLEKYEKKNSKLEESIPVSRR